MLAILGAIPPECDFSAVEVSPRYRPGSRPEVEEACRGRRIVASSDAHYLWDIAEGDPARRSPDSRPCLFEPDGDPLSRLVLSALPR